MKKWFEKTFTVVVVIVMGIIISGCSFAPVQEPLITITIPASSMVDNTNACTVTINIENIDKEQIGSIYFITNSSAMYSLNVAETNYTFEVTGLSFWTNILQAAFYDRSSGKMFYSDKTNFVVQYDKCTVFLDSDHDFQDIGIDQYTLRGRAFFPERSGDVYVSQDGGSFSNVSESENWSVTYTNMTGEHTNHYYAIDSSGEVSETNMVVVTEKNFKWNVMVYLDGDNNLEPDALVDFNEMEASTTMKSGDVNVVVLFDRSDSYSSADGNWTGTRLYQVNYDANTSMMNSTRLAGMGLSASGDTDELNMGDPANVTSFVEFVSNTYKAENSFVIFWDHGDGWRNKSSDLVWGVSTDKKKSLTTSSFLPTKKEGITRGVCYDNSSSDQLNNAEIASALTGKHFDVIGFDACLMGCLEAIYEFRGLADYMVASADLEPGDGWNYTDWLNRFNTSLTPTNLCNSLVASYAATYRYEMATTFAAYDLSKAQGVVTALDAYVDGLIAATNTWWNGSYTNIAGAIFDKIGFGVEQYASYSDGGTFNIDLWDLADKLPNASSTGLKAAIDDMVIYEWHHSSGDIFNDNPDSHGVALYFAEFMYDNYILYPYSHISGYLGATNVALQTATKWVDYLKALDEFPHEKWITSGTIASNAQENSSTFFQIYVTNTGTVNLNLTVPAGCDDDIYVYYKYFYIFEDSVWDGGVGENESLTIDAYETGWYIIEINRYIGTSGANFSLQVSEGTGKIR